MSNTMQVLAQLVMIIVDYVENGNLPPLEMPVPEWEVIDEVGPYVVFQSEDYVWDLAYLAGYLCGVQISSEGYRICRKSPLVPCWVPEVLLRKLMAMGGAWKLEGDDIVGQGEGALELLRREVCGV